MMLFQWLSTIAETIMKHTDFLSFRGSVGMQKVKFKHTEYSKCHTGLCENSDYVSVSYQKKKMRMKLCCCGLSLRYRAGAPGCGRRRTSSGPLKAPPRGCRGWSAAGPASPASRARAPAAQRSTPSLETTRVQPHRCNFSKVSSLLVAGGLQQSQKYFHGTRCAKNSTTAIWFQSDSCNKATFQLALWSARNRIFPRRPL